MKQLSNKYGCGKVLKPATLCVLLCSLLLSGGCAGIAWFVASFAPPEKVPAVYEIPKGKTVLVFVDDLSNPISYEPLKERMSVKINDMLTDAKACKEVVSYDKLFRMVTSTPDFNRMRIREVGRKVVADVVIYVSLDEFSLKDDPNINLWHGKLRTTVRVVDSMGEQLWPLDRPAGHRMEPLEMPEEVETSPAYGTTIANEMADIMARKIASLFFEHAIPREHLNEKW